MKTYLLAILLLVCSTQMFYSQEEETDGVVSLALPIRNSLKFNRYIVNPTFSFVREQNKYISITNKREWVQFADAPQTYLASYSGRFGENMGLGIGLFQQNYGVLTTFGGILNFAYNAKLDTDSNLTFGINVGAYKSGLNSGAVVTNFPDPSLDNIPSNFLLTINPGINYGTGFMDFGVSINNLALYNLNSSKLIEDNPEQSIQAHIMYTGYTDGGGFFDESRFSGLIRSEFKKDKTVISGIAMLMVPKGIWAQVGYNNLYGASAGLGLNITTQIAIEYNFEKALGDLTDFGPSHEITLAYKFKNYENYDYSREDEVSGLISGDKKRKPVSKISKLDADANRQLAAETKLKAIADAEARAEEVAKAKEAAEANAKITAENKAKEDAQAKIDIEEAILAAEIQAKEVAETKAKIAAENKAKTETKTREEAVTQAKEDAERKAKMTEEIRAKMEAEKNAAVAAQAKVKAEAKAKIEAVAAAKLLAEQKAKAEEDARIKKQNDAKLAAEAKAKLEAETKAKLEAEAKAKLDAEKLAEEKVAAERIAAEAQAKLDAENKAKLEAEAKAKLDAEKLAKEKVAAERIAAEAQAKLDAESKAKLEAEAIAKLDAEKLAKERIAAEAQAKLDAESKAKLEAEAKAKLDAEKLAKERIAAEAQAKLDAETKAKLEAEAKAKLEAEKLAKERIAAEAQAKLDAETKARLEAEAKAKEVTAAKENSDLNPSDALGKSMVSIEKMTEDSKASQKELMTRFSEAIASKNKDLKDLKEENDLGDKGVFMEPKPFKSVTEENNALDALKTDLDEAINTRNERIKELEALYEQRSKIATMENDTVNLYYQKAIKRLKAEQLTAIQNRANLSATLENIKEATEIERKRRIKRAAYDNEQDKYIQDRAALSIIKQNTKLSSVPLKTEDFDFGEKQSNNIQILKNVKNVDNGYYLILAVHNDVAKRDDFLRKVVASGRTDVDFFYDVNTSEYYIYYEKFDNIESANEALKLKGNRPYNAQLSVVKIEN